MPQENILIEQFMLHVKEDLTEIKTQTKATNGRVREMEMWKAYITGAITVMGLMVVPMFIWFLQNYILK